MTTGRINQVAFLGSFEGTPAARSRPASLRPADRSHGRPSSVRGERRPPVACYDRTPTRALVSLKSRQGPPRRPRAPDTFRIQNTARSPRDPGPNAPFRRRWAGARGALSGSPRAAGAARDESRRSWATDSFSLGTQHRQPVTRAQGRPRRLRATPMKRLARTPIAARAGIPRPQTSPTPLTRPSRTALTRRRPDAAEPPRRGAAPTKPSRDAQPAPGAHRRARGEPTFPPKGARLITPRSAPLASRAPHPRAEPRHHGSTPPRARHAPRHPTRFGTRG